MCSLAYPNAIRSAGLEDRCVSPVLVAVQKSGDGRPARHAGAVAADVLAAAPAVSGKLAKARAFLFDQCHALLAVYADHPVALERRRIGATDRLAGCT